jgi:hypothetical protein
VIKLAVSQEEQWPSSSLFSCSATCTNVQPTLLTTWNMHLLGSLVGCLAGHTFLGGLNLLFLLSIFLLTIWCFITTVHNITCLTLLLCQRVALVSWQCQPVPVLFYLRTTAARPACLTMPYYPLQYGPLNSTLVVTHTHAAASAAAGEGAHAIC